MGTSMNRDITQVIQRVKAELPRPYWDVARSLDNLLTSIRYRAPEQSWHNWNDFVVILNELPDPNAPDAPAWATKIARIMSGAEEADQAIRFD